VQRTPALRRARRRVPSRWRTRALPVVLRAGLSFVVAVTASTLGPQGPAALAWWALVVTWFRAGQIAALLGTPALLAPFFLWPVSNRAVFRHQAGIAARAWGWLALDWFLPLAVGAVVVGDAGAWLAALLFAAAQGVASLALAGWLAYAWPRLPYQPLSWVGGGLLFLAVQWGRVAGQPVELLLGGLQRVVLLTPAGWITQALTAAQRGEALGWLLGVVLLAAAGAALRAVYAAAARRFALEVVFDYGVEAAPEPRESASEPAPRDAVPAQPADPVAVERIAADAPEEETDEAENDFAGATATAAPAVPVDPAQVRRALEQVLERPAGLALFQRGFAERWITRALPPRWRVALDFLQPQGFAWARGWLIALGVLLATVALRAGGYWAEWLAWPVTLAVIFLGLPTFGGRWNGFLPAFSLVHVVPLHAFVPLGFWRMAAAILAVNAVRCVLALPLLVIAARFGYSADALPWAEAWAVGWRVLLLALALQPVWVWGFFSKGSNDSSARWWFSALIIVAAAIGAVGGITLGIALFFIGPLAALAGGVGLIALTLGALAAYGWAWGRGIFDLMGKPAPQAGS
jgi:hypothetical protein